MGCSLHVRICYVKTGKYNTPQMRSLPFLSDPQVTSYDNTVIHYDVGRLAGVQPPDTEVMLQSS